MTNVERVIEATKILEDNGIDADDADTIVEAIWNALRDDPFPEQELMTWAWEKVGVR